MTPQAHELRQYFAEAQALIILTGAGMSADSGIPTYRGEGGTWGKWEAEWDKHITEIMTPAFIAEQPVYMWQRFARGYTALKEIVPHKGYRLIRQWAIQRFGEEYFWISSNVDGQAQKAGFLPERVHEVHGASGFVQCSLPCWDKVWAFDYSIYHTLELHLDNLPRCPRCGNILRPNVYIFKDKTFVPSRVKAQRAAFDDFLVRHQGKPLLVVEIGAGAVVKTIRALTNWLVRTYNVRVIRINPDRIDAAIDAPHIGIQTTALAGLQQIDEWLR